jgi:hypothetical protein
MKTRRIAEARQFYAVSQGGRELGLTGMIQFIHGQALSK